MAHRVPQAWWALSVCGWRLWTLSGQAGARTCPPGGRLGHPTTCGPGNRWTEFGVMWPLAKGAQGQLLTPGAVSVLCDGELSLGAKGAAGGTPGRGARGRTRGVELLPAEPPWGHSGQVQPPTAGRSLALGERPCSCAVWSWGSGREGFGWALPSPSRPHDLPFPPVATGKEGWGGGVRDPFPSPGAGALRRGR